MRQVLLKSSLYLSCTLLLVAGCRPSYGQADGQDSGSGNANNNINLMAQAAQQLMPQQVQQMLPAEASQLIDYSTRPLNSGMNMMMPNTLVGFNQDLMAGASLMQQAASNGLGGLSNGYHSLNDGIRRRYQTLQQSLTDQYNNEMMRRMYDMWRNPEEMCKAIASQSQQAMQGAQQQVNQVSQTASSMLHQPTSMLRKLGSTFNPFGRR